MVGYILLIGFLLTIFIVSLYLSNWELFSPAPLFSVGMIVSVVLAAAGRGTWNTVELDTEVVLIVVLGSVFFCLGSCFMYGRFALASRICPIDKHPSIADEGTAVGRSVGLWKYALLISIALVAIVVRMSETYDIAASLGIQGSYAECAAAVRRATASIVTVDATRFGVGFSFIERQLEKVVIALGFVGAYRFAWSLVRRGGAAEIVLSGVLLLATGCFTLVKGGRGEIVMCIVAVIAIWYLLKLHDVSDIKKFTLRTVLVCATLATFVAIVFYLSGSLIGRKASSGFFEYITFYFGGSVPSLQMLLDQGVPVVEPGIRTFYGLSNLAFKFGLVDSFPSYSIAWLDLGGHGSNIFTCFARYYLDFGFVGVAVLSLLSGAFMALIYRFARRPGSICLLAVAGMLIPYIFDMAREEFVFSRLLSIHQPVTIILIVLLVLFVTRPVISDLKRLSVKLAHRSEAVG